jgi:hypothetical protein
MEDYDYVSIYKPHGIYSALNRTNVLLCSIKVLKVLITLAILLAMSAMAMTIAYGSGSSGGLTCEDVLPDDECEPGDPAIERENRIAAAGGEWVDGQWFEYDPNTYWQYEEE